MLLLLEYFCVWCRWERLLTVSEFIQIQAKKSDMLADAEARVEFLKKKNNNNNLFFIHSNHRFLSKVRFLSNPQTTAHRNCAFKGAVVTSVTLWCHNYTGNTLSHAPNTTVVAKTLTELKRGYGGWCLLRPGNAVQSEQTSGGGALKGQVPKQSQKEGESRCCSNWQNEKNKVFLTFK